MNWERRRRVSECEVLVLATVFISDVINSYLKEFESGLLLQHSKVVKTASNLYKLELRSASYCFSHRH